MAMTCTSILPLALSAVPDSAADPWRFFLLGSLAVFVFGATKAGFGGGLGMISTPLMIYACGDAMTAVAIMLPLLIAADYVTMILWWRKWDTPNALRLLPGMLVGVGAGWIVLTVFQRLGTQAGRELTNAAMTLAIGLLAVGFVALHVVRVRRGILQAYRPRPWHGSLFGSVAGLTSTLAHAAGPVVQMFLLPQQMPKGRFVATSVLFFWLTNQVKLVPYFSLGMVSTPTLGADLALLPAVIVGAAAGLFLHKRVNQLWFNRIVYTLLGAMGLHLTITSAVQLGRAIGG